MGTWKARMPRRKMRLSPKSCDFGCAMCGVSQFRRQTGHFPGHSALKPTGYSRTRSHVWPPVTGISESGVGDVLASRAFGKICVRDARFLCESVPRIAGTEPPDSESPATVSASAWSVFFRGLRAIRVPISQLQNDASGYGVGPLPIGECMHMETEVAIHLRFCSSTCYTHRH